MDYNTLVVVNTLVTVLQSAALVYVWLVHRDYRPAHDWAVGATLMMAGTLLLSQRLGLPRAAATIAGDAACFFGMAIFACGVVRACDRRPPWNAAMILAGTASLAAAAAVLAGRPDDWRAVILALTVAACDGYAVICAFRSAPGPLRVTRRLIGAILGVEAAVAVMRALAAWPGAGDLGLTPTAAQQGFMLVSGSTTVLTVWALVLLTSQRLQAELIDAARHDPLTGLLNRRAFAEVAGREWRRLARDRRGASALICDFDHFKSLNDRYGHAAGDAVLQAAGDILTRELGLIAAVSRHGGEEFVSLLPDVGLDATRAIAERIRQQVARLQLAAAPEARLSVSIGIAEGRAGHNRWEDLVAAADRALYQAKAAGRDRVRAA